MSIARGYVARRKSRRGFPSGLSPDNKMDFGYFRKSLIVNGAGGQNRTDTLFPKPDFESGAFRNSQLSATIKTKKIIELLVFLLVFLL